MHSTKISGWTLFTRKDNIQIWVDLINKETNDIHLEIVKNGNQNTLKELKENFANKGNIIIEDAHLYNLFYWPFWFFLSIVNFIFDMNSIFCILHL